MRKLHMMYPDLTASISPDQIFKPGHYQILLGFLLNWKKDYIWEKETEGTVVVCTQEMRSRNPLLVSLDRRGLKACLKKVWKHFGESCWIQPHAVCNDFRNCFWSSRDHKVGHLFVLVWFGMKHSIYRGHVNLLMHKQTPKFLVVLQRPWNISVQTKYTISL